MKKAKQEIKTGTKQSDRLSWEQAVSRGQRNVSGSSLRLTRSMTATLSQKGQLSGAGSMVSTTSQGGEGSGQSPKRQKKDPGDWPEVDLKQTPRAAPMNAEFSIDATPGWRCMVNTQSFDKIPN